MDNFALHAIAHAVHVEEEFDDPRPLNTVATHSLARWAAVPRSIPSAKPGEHARSRRVRLTSNLDQQLTAVPAAQQHTASAVIPDALAEYLRTHPAS